MAVAAGCSSADDASNNSDSDLISGVDAIGAQYDAIGALVIVGNDQTQALCTGTLIGPSTVLTAKHCTMGNPSKEGSPTNVDSGKVYFLVGQNAQHPAQVVQASAATPSNIFQGGFTGLGSDVGIYTLKTPITNIEPLKVAPVQPGAAQVNTKYTAIGYGIQDAAGTVGTRKMGNVTLRSVTGAPAHLAYPNADAYLAAILAMVPAAQASSITDAQKAGIKSQYDIPMSNGYEIYVGGAAGDSQICHGDSGGPLLSTGADGKFVVNGVASTTMDQAGNVCKSGGMYAVFGANTRELIASKIGDKCAPDATTGILACGLASIPTTCAALDAEEAKEGSNAQGSGDAATPASASFLSCVAGSCCAETADCFGDTGCSTLSACFDSCGSAGGDATAQQACAQTCYGANSASYDKYLGFQICAKNNCSTESAPAPTRAAAQTHL